MKQETIEDLKKESALRRSRALSDNEIADRIDEIVRAIDPLSSPGPKLSFAGLKRGADIPRMTQTEILKKVLRLIGRPANISDIVQRAVEERMPLSNTTVDNLRSVMSRNPEFKSYGGGVWGLAEFAQQAGEQLPVNTDPSFLDDNEFAEDLKS